MRPKLRRTAAALLVLSPALSGCGHFAEQSFPMESRDLVHLTDADVAPASQLPADTRAWLRCAQSRLDRLMPHAYGSTLITENLVTPDGRPRDLFRHFGYTRRDLRTLAGNFSGLRCTAECGSTRTVADGPAPAWPGFEDLWIPMSGDFALSGRIGWATRDGQVQDADGIILLPGLFGDNGVVRTHDLARALVAQGFHVLSLEPRGHGRTELRYPDHYYLFGIVETDELLRVSDWLESRPHVRRTGLIGFCWNANQALLAAWYDGRRPEDPSVPSYFPVTPFVTLPRDRPRFSAGIMAFSPVVRWEELIERLDTNYSLATHPHLHSVQETLVARMRYKGYPRPDGSLRRLIDCEYERVGFDLPGSIGQGYRFLRLYDHHGMPSGGKLESIRVPVLIVHGANDPLTPAQEVADLMATVSNPRVAAIVLPDGGHVGFAAHAKAHYFSLVLNFFDPRCGAAALCSAAEAR